MRDIITLLTILLFSQTGFAQCQTGQVEVAIQVLTDNYGYETTWELKNGNGNILASGGQGGVYENNALYGDTICVDENECLRFDIADDFGDGICCNQGNGSYSIYINGVLNASGGEFNDIDFEIINCLPGTSCDDALVVSEGVFTAPSTDTWYSFTPLQNGTYEINACNNSCDSRIWVYDYCNGLIWEEDNTGTIYYDDDQGGCGPQATIGGALLEGGEEYWIRIGSDNADCQDTISWSLSYNGPVEGCMDPNACNFNPLATISNNSCLMPGDPSCPDGPDLIIDSTALSNSLYMASLDVPANDCNVEEGCLNGYGMRDIIRFTTHIKNIGNLDYYIGSPSANPDQFDFQNCHNHTHYKGYAEYKLYDANGTEIPIGFKTGFCVMDLECSGGGTAQYGCSTMGITAGCGDIYASGLSCQWIDVTDVDTGLYTFVNTCNWDNDPDALGRYELNLMNNWAQLCIYLGKDVNGDMYVEQVPGCQPYTDCLGQLYGNAQLDCNGECDGPTLRGDINTDAVQNVMDAQQYVDDILANDIQPSTCNDLNDDGEIDVYDASLMVDCSLTEDGHVTGSPHDHCNFPYGVENIFDTIELSIGNVDHNQQFIDIYIKNPDNYVVAYQFEMSGITIESVENLVDPVVYPITPEWSLGGTEVIGISYQDSLIPRYQDATPLCRVHYFNVTDTLICITDIKSVVNQNYEETINRVDGFNACLVASTDVDEHEDGGVKLSLFPNPMTSSSTLQINNRYNANLSVSIIDPSGKVIREYGRIRTNRLEILKSDLSGGMYFVQVTDDKRVLARHKMMVQ